MKKICSVGDCEKEVRSIGLCITHYRQEYRKRSGTKEKIKQYNKSESAKLSKKKYQSKPEVRKKQYEAIRAYTKKRLQTDPEFREKHLERMRKYSARPEMRQKDSEKRSSQRLTKAIQELNEGKMHSICRDFGKPINHFRSDSTYIMKCLICNVSYSTRDKAIFYRKNKCPCCHRMLRMRKRRNMKKQEIFLKESRKQT